MDATKQELIDTYSRKLVDDARSNGDLTSLFDEVHQVLTVFDQQHLETFFRNTTIDDGTKATILSLFQKEVSPTLKTFFDQILLRRDYPLVYPALAEVIHYSQAAMGQYDMRVTTAVPLLASQRLRLIEKTETLLGLKVRQLIEVVDPEILGGFIIEANHKVIDASVRHQLQQIKNEIK